MTTERKMRGLMGLGAVVLFGVASTASAQLLITEIHSNQSLSGAAFQDWFEVTNFGGSAVDLSGWIFDDDSANPALGFRFGDLSIAAGESIVFVERLTPEEFRDWWGPLDGVQIVTYSGSGLGLGRGDAVNLFDADGELQLSLSYRAPGGFITSDGSPSGFDPTDPTRQPHAGQAAGAIETWISLLWDPAFGIDEPRYTFAVDGTLGAFQAQGFSATGERALDVGSPGAVIPAPGAAALLGLGGLLAVGRRRR